MTDLAKACIYYRARNNLTQLELAARCGVDRTTINKVERGGEVSELTKAKILIVTGEKNVNE